MLHRQKGNAIIEFALGATLFITLMVTICELGLMFWATLSMQHAVREGARYAVTGLTDMDPSPTNPTRYNAVMAKIKEQSLGLYDTLSPTVQVNTISSSGVLQPVSGQSFGNPGEIVVITIDCHWPFVTPFLKPFFTGGRYDFSVSATMRNEMFVQ